MKIGIIGASSQVGSSLAFYLKHFSGAEPVCFIRSGYSRVFFEMAGLTYVTTDIKDSNALRQAFSSLDGVIDCTYPSGQLYEIPESIRENLKAIISALPENSFFIYMSTIMAFGMPTGFRTVKHFTIPQTTYSFIKRKAENITDTLCAKFNVRGYNFRLGQVHGFLQSVNGSYREKFRYGDVIRVNGKPDDLVNVIFIPTLAEAILKAAGDQIKPGLYSLVNEPQWTLQQLHDFYFSYYEYGNAVVFDSAGKTGIRQSTKKFIANHVRKWRPLLESYILLKREELYKKVKGRFRVSEMAGSAYVKSETYTDFHLIGRNPGKLISGMHCSVTQVIEKEKQMEEKYDQLLLLATRSDKQLVQ